MIIEEKVKGKLCILAKEVQSFYCAYMIRRRSRKTKKIFVEYDSWQRYEMELRKEKGY